MLPLWVYAQRLPRPDVLTIAEGLGFRNVTALAQDSRGLMWFGTAQGLERYDGLHFIKFGNDPEADFHFPGGVVLDEGLISVNDSTLWTVADGQLYAIDLSTHISKNLSALSGLTGEICLLRQSGDGTIYLVTDEKSKQVLYKHEGDLRFRQIAASSHLRTPFNSVACDPDGNVWWSTNAEGLRQFGPDGELLHAVKPDSFIWYGTKLYFAPVFVDSRSRVFILPKSANQIWQYHPEDGSHDILADNLPSPAYFSLEDSQGNVWFSTQTGVLRWGNSHGTGASLTDFTGPMRSALQYLNINDIFEDRTHILWIATDNGLIRFPVGRQLFRNYLTEPGVAWSNSMRGIFQANSGAVYAFCDKIDNGLYRLDPSTGESILEFPSRYSLRNPVLEQSAKHFVYDKKENTAWALTDKLLEIDLDEGLCRVAGEFEGIAEKLDHNPFIMLKDGAFLLGFKLENLTLYDPKTGLRSRLFPDGLSGVKPTHAEVFLEDAQGRLWVGTMSGGLFCFNRQGEILAHFSTRTKPALSKDHVLSLLFDQEGRLWVGTFGGGLTCLSGDLSKFKNLTTRIFTQKEGLCDNNVVSMLEDDEGNIWSATYNGLSCYLPDEGVFRNFYEEDGLSGNEFNYTSALKDSKGHLWFGGMNGLNVLDPGDFLQTERNPPLCLTGFTKYNYRSDSTEVRVIGNRAMEELVISPYDSWFQISWALPNYFKPDKNHYYVWLDGLEEGWSSLGSTPFVRFNKLPPGNYTLRVKGSDSNGNWSESELALPLTVRPFFYQTWWFFLIALAFFSGIAFILIRYRVQRILEMERMRTRIASDLHDEVGSMLSGLAMQAELLEMSAAEQDRSRLSHVADISRAAVSKMRELVWSIDSRRDRVKNLLDRMREQAADLLQPRDIAYRFELGDLPLEKKLPVDMRLHLFLIFKEALTNVLRHSNATEVVVRFGNFGDRFELSIQDNGSSIQQKKLSTGLGLSNMEMRARRLRAKLEVERATGFTVRLTMKRL